MNYIIIVNYIIKVNYIIIVNYIMNCHVNFKVNCVMDNSSKKDGMMHDEL